MRQRLYVCPTPVDCIFFCLAKGPLKMWFILNLDSGPVYRPRLSKTNVKTLTVFCSHDGCHWLDHSRLGRSAEYYVRRVMGSKSFTFFLIPSQPTDLVHKGRVSGCHLSSFSLRQKRMIPSPQRFFRVWCSVKFAPKCLFCLRHLPNFT